MPPGEPGTPLEAGVDPETNPQLRRPTPADYPAVVAAIDEWWGRTGVHVQLPRLWFEHFSATSWLAVEANGSPAGFIVGFISPERPTEAIVVLSGVRPTARRRGLGRRLHEAFANDARTRGATLLVESAWPGDPGAMAFLRAIGFAPSERPGTRRLYGTPALPDHEWDREDRAIFERAP